MPYRQATPEFHHASSSSFFSPLPTPVAVSRPCSNRCLPIIEQTTGSGGAPGGDWRQGTKQIHPFSRENCFMLLLYCLTILMHMIFIVLIWFTFFFYDPDFFGALPAIWCPTQCALCAFAELRHCACVSVCSRERGRERDSFLLCFY